MVSTTQLVSIVLVDDQPLFRKGLQTLLNFYSDSGSQQVQIVGEAATLNQALKLVREQHPTLVLLDLELGDTHDNIISFVQWRELSEKTKVLVLSAHREDEWIFRAMQAGARGYVFKHCLAHQLCHAIATVLNNEIYLPPEATTSFFRMFHFYAGHSLATATKLKFTEREQEVLHWLVQGESNETIAQNLYVTVATVKAHLTSIFEKLGVRSRSQAIIKALKLGIV